jgi:hypothetical protein
MSDGTELLAADLAAAGIRLDVAASAVLAKGALNIKTDWRTNASGLKHAPAYPYSISYDIHAQPGHLEAEIGPDKARPQGALGNLIEFGSAHNAPHLDGARALAAEEPRFYAALEDVCGSAVLP